MTVKKKTKSSSESPKELSELLVLGHLIKYNLYMLGKATVFAAVMAKSKDLHTALFDTEKAMGELDLDTKMRKEQKDS
jgi:hypothetical protein